MSELILQELRLAQLGPVNLQVRSDDIVCISGASGSGKSLLLRAIGDIIPYSGTVMLDRQPARSMPAPQWRQRVGLLPAENQWWRDQVYEHFTQQDESMLNALGFNESCWQWQLANCSTGEKQRLALLRLLSRQPKCLLLDEPTASLDPDSTQRVEAVIHDYRVRHNTPVIWVSHLPEQIRRVATRHFKMIDGALEAQ